MTNKIFCYVINILRNRVLGVETSYTILRNPLR